MLNRVVGAWVVALMMWLVIAVCETASAADPVIATAATPAHIEWTDCPQPSAEASLSGASLQCGWLHTGETIKTSAGRQALRLRMAVLRARPGRPARHPVIFVPGGPGDAAGLDAASLRRWQQFQQTAGWPSDIVLFDPRGTGQSRPRASCVRHKPSSASGRRNGCMDLSTRNAVGAVIDVFGPAAQARDVVALMDALRVESATLWAVSYGTRIARTAAAAAPERIQALVLDSLIGVPQSRATDERRATRRSVELMSRRCRHTLRCRLTVPSLPLAIEVLLNRAAQQAAQIVWADVPYKPQALRVTPKRIMSMLALAGYRPASAADSAARIKQAARQASPQSLWPLASLLSGVVNNTAHDGAVYEMTRCAYQTFEAGKPQSTPHEVSPDGLEQWLALPLASDRCGAWPVSSADPAPTVAPVPTLLISGEQDVVAPAAAAARFAAGRPFVWQVLLPEGGHASTLSDEHAQKAVQEFLRQVKSRYIPG